MTIYERALEMVPNGANVGLGSGRAAWAFVKLLGERIKRGGLTVRGVAASEETTKVAMEAGVPLIPLAEAGELDLTVDGADEVDPNCDLIKGYGRALVREKIIAASSKKIVILVGEEKLVPQLGWRGKLPVEVMAFGLNHCTRILNEAGLAPALWMQNGKPGRTDNGNHILDCVIRPILRPFDLEMLIRAIPGVVGTGLFLGMADTVLVGDSQFEFQKEMNRGDTP